MPLPTSAPATAPTRSPIAPREPAAAQASGRLNLPPQPGWVAMLHPAAWELVEDGEGHWHVLPRTLKIQLVPGVGGVVEARDRDGRPVADPTHAIESYGRRGFVACARGPVWAHGIELPHYCVGYEVVRGLRWLWAWELPEARLGRANVSIDRDARIAWLSRQMAAALGVESPPDHVVDAIRAREEDQAISLIVEARNSPRAAQRLQRSARRLHSLGWAGLDGLPQIEGLPERRPTPSIQPAGLSPLPPADPAPTTRRRS